MDFRNRSALRSAACQALDGARGDPLHLILCFSGITALLSAVSMLLSFYLSHQIAGTGGLGNLGLRSVLSTAQSILPYVQMAVIACMELGYHIAVLRIARGQAADHRTLAEGFRRAGPLIRALLLQGLIYLGLLIAGTYLSTVIFLMLPASDAFYQAAEPLLSGLNGGTAVLDEATAAALLPTLLPMLWISGAVALLLLIPMAYRFRMIPFCLAEDSRPGALAAMRRSRALMRRNRFALFRLDLGFWWYYVLLTLASALCYGDSLLELLNIALPISAEAGYLLFGLLGIGAQFAVQYFLMNRVWVTYAEAYDALQTP